MKTSLLIQQHKDNQTFSVSLRSDFDGYISQVLVGGTKDQARLVLASCEAMNAVHKGTLYVKGMSLLK